MTDQLDRAIGVSGAVLLGLGSILGTGVFVSLGIAAGIAGPAVIIAVAIAAVLATCNGLASAQLAASHLVSGGTYEYACRYLNAPLGFTAGWLFLCAKSASAATAALGLAHYLELPYPRAVAIGATLVVTAVVAGGIRRSNRTNAVIVAITLAGLVAFVALGASRIDTARFVLDVDVRDLLHATALAFVAYTGYGRIATLGEEVRDPSRTIPRAVVLALAVSGALYVAVAIVIVGTGAPPAASTNPVVTVAAITAMAGVLLNLVLGLSRVLLAMARRGDMPRALAAIDARQSPRAAVIVTGLGIAGLAAIGNVKTTWSFSAFTVLVYYAITNLAALRLPPEHRRFPRALSVIGLVTCLALAGFVERTVWLAGLGVIAAGLVWFSVARRMAASDRSPPAPR